MSLWNAAAIMCLEPYSRSEDVWIHTFLAHLLYGFHTFPTELTELSVQNHTFPTECL